MQLGDPLDDMGEGLGGIPDYEEECAALNSFLSESFVETFLVGSGAEGPTFHYINVRVRDWK